MTEAARHAKAHCGDIDAKRAVKVFNDAECFHSNDEWIEEELENDPNTKGWPSTATATPYNLRNNVPWDRVHQWKSSLHNSLVLTGVKYFCKMRDDCDYDRVSISHVAVCHVAGMMLMSADLGLPNGSDSPRTASNRALDITINKAYTAWGSGTALSRLLGNENRLFIWKGATNLAALHLAVPYSQVIELSQHLSFHKR